MVRRFHSADICLMDRYLSSSPLHPGFWCRVRLDNAIAAHASLASGRLLDVGCGMKPYLALFEQYTDEYLGLEYSPESGYRGNLADLCGDAAQLPIADAAIDTLLCTEVLEHLPNPEKTIAEFARVLRPGGILITTAPFAFPVHDELDFFRYSPKGLAAIMERYGLVVEKVQPLSGTAVTLALNLNLYLFGAFIWKKSLYPIGLLLRPLLFLIAFIINGLGWVSEKFLPDSSLAFNHLTIARKPAL